MNKISGVYKITNTITDDFYIGSSRDVKHRWADHRSASTWANQPNSRMYQDMTQFGLNNFTFEIIEKTDNLKVREQYYIDLLKPSYNSRNANGIDIKRYYKRCKEYYNTNKDKIIAYSKEHMKEYRQTEDGKESNRKCARKSMKRYNNQICLYNGETIKLNALSQRFYKQGIPHPTLEAKKYLMKVPNYIEEK
jgi:group I intron endonuclease